MSDYTPLVMPTLPASPAPNYASTANFLSQSVTALVNSGNQFLGTLSDLKNIDFSQVGDLPTYAGAVYFGDTSAISERPVRPVINTDLSDLLARINALTAPIAPTSNFEYNDPGYSSGLRDPLLLKLLNDLINGGYGIDNNDELMLVQRERDRAAQILRANIEEAQRLATATSFPMPQGSLQVALNKARQEYMSGINTTNREVALKRADMFVENRRFIIEKVLASEEQSIALYNAVQNRVLTAAKTEVELAVAIFDAGIKYFSAQLDALNKQMAARIEINRMTAYIYQSDVQAYASFVNAVTSAAQVAIANTRNLIERDKAVLQSRVDVVKFRLQQLMTTVENAKQINEYATEYFRTGLGAGMASINGLAVQTSSV